jgi:hypothetical protein
MKFLSILLFMVELKYSYSIENNFVLKDSKTLHYFTDFPKSDIYYFVNTTSIDIPTLSDRYTHEYFQVIWEKYFNIAVSKPKSEELKQNYLIYDRSGKQHGEYYIYYFHNIIDENDNIYIEAIYPRVDITPISFYSIYTKSIPILYFAFDKDYIYMSFNQNYNFNSTFKVFDQNGIDMGSIIKHDISLCKNCIGFNLKTPNKWTGRNLNLTYIFENNQQLEGISLMTDEINTKLYKINQLRFTNEMRQNISNFEWILNKFIGETEKALEINTEMGPQVVLKEDLENFKSDLIYSVKNICLNNFGDLIKKVNRYTNDSKVKNLQFFTENDTSINEFLELVNNHQNELLKFRYVNLNIEYLKKNLIEKDTIILLLVSIYIILFLSILCQLVFGVFLKKRFIF